MKLLKLPYVVTESGLQWAAVIEDWLINTINMWTVTVISKLFINGRENGSILMIVAKVTDDLLLVGTKLYLGYFFASISVIFDVSKEILDAPNNFIGCIITQE